MKGVQQKCYYSSNIKVILPTEEILGFSLILFKNISFEATFPYAHVPIHWSMHFEQDIRPCNKQTHPSKYYGVFWTKLIPVHMYRYRKILSYTYTKSHFPFRVIFVYAVNYTTLDSKWSTCKEGDPKGF